MRKTLYLLAVAGYVAFVAAAVQAQAPSVDRPNPGSSPGLSARFRLTSAPSLRGSGISRAFRLAPTSGPNLPGFDRMHGPMHIASLSKKKNPERSEATTFTRAL